MQNYREAARIFEPKWRAEWFNKRVFHTPNPGDPGFNGSARKFVVLDFFPYPSGIGLHIGHPLGYIATDILARHLRMSGYNVLHSMGFDSFGLPAEQYAVQTGQHPEVTTRENTSNMLKQLRALGLGHDEDRRFSTTDPEYYKWTQWIFLRLFESYYDRTLVWTDRFGRTITGRARPVQELRDKLVSGEWKLDANGLAGPADGVRFTRTPPSEELRRAIDLNRLAVIGEIEVNWCPMLGTVLSNEEVTNEGFSERGNYPVYRRPLRQWVLRITEYAERLLSDLELVNWPLGVVEMQRNWIGRSAGADVSFPVGDGAVKVFTTRPDTIFGATFLALAADHPQVDSLVTEEQDGAVQAFLERQSAIRLARSRDQVLGKDGVFTGTYARHALSGEAMPIWLADYVLREYGTGAIMAVPAHDQRDFEFAKLFGLPIRAVVMPSAGWLQSNAPLDASSDDAAHLELLYRERPREFRSAFEGVGISINSEGGGVKLDGLPSPAAIEHAVEALASAGLGHRRVQYKLRDWLFSRQRYWGEPFPVVYSDGSEEVYAVDDASLPILLPEMTDFSPSASSDVNAVPTPPLARAREWMKCRGVLLPSGRVRIAPENSPAQIEIDGQLYATLQFHRDPNTMPNWAGSCWYYLRYFDPHNTHAFVDPVIEQYWTLGPPGSHVAYGAVDLYVGGTEHAVLHLLYSRFWHKVLYDLELVSTPEPYQQLYNQGMITADAYRDARGVYVDVHDVSWRVEGDRKIPYDTKTGEDLIVDPGKMGKRYKNGIPPEEITDLYTTDTFRSYEMYLGPLDQGKPWQTEPIIGIYRFLDGVWRLATNLDPSADATQEPDAESERLVHKTIEGVTQDIRALRMNTALSKLIILYNSLTRKPPVARSHVVTLCTLLAPFAPHLAEELFQNYLGLPNGVQWTAYLRWPVHDPALAADRVIEVPIQVNGRKRDDMTVPVAIDDATLESLAVQRPNVKKYLGAGPVRRVVVINREKQKLVNIVVG